MKILYLPSSLCQQRQLEKPNFTAYPVLLAMEAEWYRKQGHEVYWGKQYVRVSEPNRGLVSMWDENFSEHFEGKIISEPEGLPFLSLPHPDRVFTRAKDPIYQKNGNFKFHPATYIQSANGCWWGKCSFCVENGKPYEVRDPYDIGKEMWEIGWQGYKEVFDDAATFNSKDRSWWFTTIQEIGSACNRFGMRFSCNYRIGEENWSFLKLSGFRMLLFGVESANQETLDRIQKGVKVADILPTLQKAWKAGLEPHIAVIFGFPWESDADAFNTLKLVWFLLRKGYAKTAQASFIYQQGIKGNESQRHFVRDIYGVWKFPDFWFNKIRDIKNKEDLRYLWTSIKAALYD